MPTTLVSKTNQHCGTMFESKIKFNQIVVDNFGESTKPEGNLFLMMDIRSRQGCQFPVTPHEGFEIITLVINGQIDYIDNITNQWQTVNKGKLQIIKSGSGLSYASSLSTNCRILQLWLDPGYQHMLKEIPEMSIYDISQFNSEVCSGMVTKSLIDEQNLVISQTSGLVIKIANLEINSSYSLPLSQSKITYIYCISGSLNIENYTLKNLEAVKFTGQNLATIQTVQKAQLLVVEVLETLDYKPVWMI